MLLDAELLLLLGELVLILIGGSVSLFKGCLRLLKEVFILLKL